MRTPLTVALVLVASANAVHAQAWGESIVFGTTVPVPFDMVWGMHHGSFDSAAGRPCGTPNESDLEAAIVQAYEDAGRCDTYDPELYDAYADSRRNAPDHVRRTMRLSVEGFFAFHGFALEPAAPGQRVESVEPGAWRPCGLTSASDLETDILRAYADADQCDAYDPALYAAYVDSRRGARGRIQTSVPTSVEGFFAFHGIALDGGAPRAATRQAGLADDRPAPVSSTAFVPDPARRSGIARAFVDRVEAASGWSIPHGDDLFGDVADEIAEVSLSPNDLADVVAVYLVNVWAAATGERVEPTPALAAAVAAQARGAIDAGGGVPPDVQGRSDELLLQAWLVSSLDMTFSRVGGAGPFREAMQRAGREAFGLDLRALALTERGFVPR